jgi:nucleotide-binding universal stress UspA family protein
MSFNKILVPLDGSALAESALGRAASLAAKNGTLVLMRAAEAHTLPGADPTEAQVEVVRDAEEYLASVAARLATNGSPRVETSVWYGPAASAIVDAARLRKADLIVMSTHGRSGLGRLIMGSVAESVLRGTTAPILLLRAETAPVAAPEEAAPAGHRETAHV